MSSASARERGGWIGRHRLDRLGVLDGRADVAERGVDGVGDGVDDRRLRLADHHQAPTAMRAAGRRPRRRASRPARRPAALPWSAPDVHPERRRQRPRERLDVAGPQRQAMIGDGAQDRRARSRRRRSGSAAARGGGAARRRGGSGRGRAPSRARRRPAPSTTSACSKW